MTECDKKYYAGQMGMEIYIDLYVKSSLVHRWSSYYTDKNNIKHYSEAEIPKHVKRIIEDESRRVRDNEAKIELSNRVITKCKAKIELLESLIK